MTAAATATPMFTTATTATTALTAEEIFGLKNVFELFSGRFGVDLRASLIPIKAALDGLQAETLDLSALRALVGLAPDVYAENPEIMRLLSDDDSEGAVREDLGRMRSEEAIEDDLYEQRLLMADARKDRVAGAPRVAKYASKIAQLDTELDARRAAAVKNDGFKRRHVQLIAAVREILVAEKEEGERMLQRSEVHAHALSEVGKYKKMRRMY